MERGKKSPLFFGKLDNSNFLLYAARCYDNPQCISEKEFYDDVDKFKYIKRLISRGRLNENINIKLIMNHLITIFNVFGIVGSIKMIEYSFDKKTELPIIKPILLDLCYIKDTDFIDIPLDARIVKQLRNEDY
jgi:hypothetical protein